MRNIISIHELSDRLDRGEAIQIVDVRSPGEYEAGHVPSAINIPLEQLEARLADLGKAPIALVCQSGTRAGIACEVLMDHHDGLMLVDGGTAAWIEAGKPAVRTTATRWSLERQVRLIAGLLVLIGTVLSISVAPQWVYLAMFVGAGLTFAGLTNVCGMALLLAKLPWNKPSVSQTKTLVESKS